MEKIIWYDKFKGLQGNVLSKARKFNRLKLIEMVGARHYKVKHIKGYNKNDYDVEITPEGIFTCNCQFFDKNKRDCSHILAVRLYLENKLGDKNENI